MLPPPRSQRSFSDSETQSDNITPSMAPYYFQENCQTPYCDSQGPSWSGSSLISSLRLYPWLRPLPEVLNDYHSSVIQAFTCAVGFSSQPFWSTPNHPLSSREDQKTKKKSEKQEEKWSAAEAGEGERVKEIMVNAVRVQRGHRCKRRKGIRWPWQLGESSARGQSTSKVTCC